MYYFILSLILILYTIVFYLFFNLKFQTRKYKDFKLWTITLKCHKLGYFYLLKGRFLIINIGYSINKNRYSFNFKGLAKLITADEIEKIFLLKPSFDFSHIELIQ